MIPAPGILALFWHIDRRPGTLCPAKRIQVGAGIQPAIALWTKAFVRSFVRSLVRPIGQTPPPPPPAHHDTPGPLAAIRA
jgi:hypothetical protein